MIIQISPLHFLINIYKLSIKFIKFYGILQYQELKKSLFLQNSQKTFSIFKLSNDFFQIWKQQTYISVYNDVNHFNFSNLFLTISFLLYLKRYQILNIINNKMKKMLLMGSEGAGKTSMHSVIFANYPAKQTHKIGYTVERKQHRLKFMGNLTFNLWDCGGQDTFMDNYFMVQRETIFKNVEVVIYVFDIQQPEEKLKKSLEYWKLAVKSVQEYNENGAIFILIHKIDKIPEERRQQAFEKKKQQINNAIPAGCKVKVKKFFATSIWDETLYQAWSQIVQLLIPNRQKIEETLQQICENSLCQEAALFQRSTFLILGHYHKQGKNDLLKYEKIANIIKQFKLTCNKYASNIEQICIQTNTFNTLIMQFTKTENILIIYKNRRSKTAAQLNVQNMGKVFEEDKKQFMNTGS